MLLHIIKVTQSTVIFIERLFKDLLLVVSKAYSTIVLYDMNKGCETHCNGNI